MSMTRAMLNRAYGKQKRTAVADATGLAILDFGRPSSHTAWVVHRVFIRATAGATIRLIVGSDPGDGLAFEPSDEVDSVTATFAVSSGDEIEVDGNEPIWALITGVAAASAVSGQIRYRQLSEAV